MNSKMKAAIKYGEMGYSIIPVKPDKRPYLDWKQYQTRKADETEIKQWWDKWPNANVGIVTGELSGITVVDIDSEKGKEALNEYLPDTLQTPAVKTPNGEHLFFKHEPGISNAVRVITDCDIRNDGGYVVAPPSQNGSKVYTWLNGLNPVEVKPAAMPEPLADILRCANPASTSEHNINKVCTNTNAFLLGERNNSEPQQAITSATKRNIRLVKGQRDDDLFHIANCLYKGGMHPDNISKLLQIFGSNCSPPMPEKEIQVKIKSVLDRAKNKDFSLTAEIRQWVSATWGNISATQAQQNITNATIADRKKIRVILGRLVKEGVLEREPNRNGVYRKVDSECDEISFLNVEIKTVDLWLPFNLHKMVQIMPGNIIVIAGEPNAGKTAALLNVIHSNMDKWKTHYFSSEMGASELRNRLKNFDGLALTDWNFKAYERTQNFGDVIKPGEGNLNVIDFLELYDNFYEVSGRLSEIHNKLKGAIAIVALQKNPGQDARLGGQRGLEKPRLYLAMGHGYLKVVKAKNWQSKENPNGKQVNFKIVGGCNFIQTQKWHRPD